MMDNAIVVSHSALVSKVAIKMIKAGGNAYDAAIAASLAMGVSDPGLSGIGGGGFLLHYNSDSGIEVLDYREVAPFEVDPDVYVEDVSRASVGCTSIGVPGSIKGLIRLHEKYGVLPLKMIFEESVRLAVEGVSVSKLWNFIFERFPGIKEKVVGHKESRRIFSRDGLAYKPGERLVQKDLGRTLEAIADEGWEVFYEGWVAERIVDYMEECGGFLTSRDLENYEVRWREPLRFELGGLEFYTMPPPGSGVIVGEGLKILEETDLDDGNYVEKIYRALSIALEDRLRYVSDPDYTGFNPYDLLEEGYVRNRLMNLGVGRLDISGGDEGTIFLATADAEGNIVALNETLECFMGSGVTIPGLGILMNDEIHDFSFEEGSPNYIAPNKRPASSMSPTIVFDDSEPILVIGASGGLRIISAIIQTLAQYLFLKRDLETSIKFPRLHIEDNKLLTEDINMVDFDAGREVVYINRYIASPHGDSYSIYMGNIEAIEVRGRRYYGFSDPRKGYGVEVL